MKESESLRKFGYEHYENKTARLKVESTIECGYETEF